ncbi:endonuclease/exonuclease/phosphatase family protein [Ligilactobacillus agilis]|uniref:endonuclease/exonuclease/phosphatase family protein n=1 Tax=Ligilactobacillus agilis TaxID=1601 RepID=UPI00254D21E9|nr:endonuclease/exonuclease/phosphatase family protein [Ligilactobacillus agilis]MDK6808847.1 hypothetical protein [Ligilactobacillus agilis]
MRNLTVLEWNIRGAASAGWNNRYEIKHKVSDDIVKTQSDIIIINEFVLSKGWDYLQETLLKNDYIFFQESGTSTNGILLAIKKNLLSKKIGDEIYDEDFKVLCNRMDTSFYETPNFLQLRVSGKGNDIFIIGVRVRMGNKETQLKALREHLDTLPDNSQIIVAGDFNMWDSVLSRYFSSPYSVESPKHSGNSRSLDAWSFVFKNGGRAPLDHLVVKGIQVIEARYNWNFMTGYSEYAHLKNTNYLGITSVPDHAMLLATISI